MGGIFICYRRDDSAPWAGRVYDSLVREWGDDLVFMDVDAIAPGEDFRKVISETVTRSGVVLVVIGPGWVTATDASGTRRLEDEGDVHRTEVVSALASDARVIPVLVGGAHMPKVADLPEPLRELAFRNAVVLEDRRFGSDVRALQKALSRFADEVERAPTVEEMPEPASESGPEPEAEPRPEAEAEPMAAPEPGPEPKAAPESEPEPERRAPEPEPQAERQPAVAPAAAATPAPTPVAATAPVPEAAGPPAGRKAAASDPARPWVIVAGVAAAVAAVFFIVATVSVVNYFDGTILRTKNFGAGDLPVLLAAGAFAAAGALALVPALRLPMLGAATAVGLPLALQILRNRSIGLYYCDYDCVLEAPAGRAFAFAGPLVLLAAVLCCVALWRAGGFKPSRWAPPRLEAITIAVIALWVATAAINLYSIDDTDYGSAVFGHGPAATLWGFL